MLSYSRYIRRLVYAGMLAILGLCTFLFMEHSPSGRISLSSVTECTRPLREDELTIRGIEQFSNEQGFHSAREILPCLPISMRARFMLVHHSGSPQKATPLEPRAVLISTRLNIKESNRPRMKFAATFTEQASDFEMVEADERLPVGRRLRFAKLDFSTSPPHIESHSCKMCHGPTPRLIIDSYPFWKGFYGERVNHCSQDEIRWFSEFQAAAPHTATYRWLIGLDHFFTVMSNDPSRCVVMRNQGVHDTMIFEIADRMARLLSETPDYENLKFAIFAGALGCANPEEYLTKTALKAFTQKRFLAEPFREGNVETAFRMVKGAAAKLDGGGGGGVSQMTRSKFKDHAFTGKLSRLFFWDTFVREDQEAGLDLMAMPNTRYLIEGRGISMKEWSADRELGRYRNASGSQNGFELAAALESADPDLDRVGAHPPLGYNNSVAEKYREGPLPGVCKSLQVASLRALGGRTLATIPPPAAVFPTALKNRCANCHNGTGKAPEISFGDQKKLALELPIDLLSRKIVYRISDGAGHQRMPPMDEAELSSRDRSAILRYLRDLGYDAPDSLTR